MSIIDLLCSVKLMMLGWGNAIRSMSVGRRHAGFIDDYGHTYMVGDNTFGQCGRKIKAKNVNPEVA